MRLRPRLLVPILAAVTAAIAFQPQSETARWEQQARNITIVRDDWGIAHVYGKTDADAVFGAIYAQAEDDFNRVETNYINSMGRLAEAEGESKIWQDLRMKLFIDPGRLEEAVRGSPAWLQEADERLGGRAQLLPRQTSRGEAARDRALRAVDGAQLHRRQHRRRHRDGQSRRAWRPSTARTAASAPAAPARRGSDEPRGSNGMAIAPSNTAGKHALLLINPHTSFFFRSELQMVSEEGLNAYGAVDMGPVLHLPGLQRARRLDAHLERRRRRRRVPGDHRRRRATGTSTSTAAKSARSPRQEIIVPYKTGTGDGAEEVHRLPHAPRSRRPRGRRQVGRASG